MADRDDDDIRDDDPDAPASAEEIAASQRLRDALEGADAGALPSTPEVELALSLRAAWDPGSLGEDESRAVLDATPSAEELELATSLREALADGPTPELVQALRSAFSPSALEESEHRAILEAALSKMPEKRGADVLVLRRRATVVRIGFGVVTGGLALAASIFFVVTSAPIRTPDAPLAKARTTQPLFSEPFKAGETSARIDKIASARASDFRDNRFTKWGVR